MIELIISGLFGYFLMRLDSIEKKLDRLENMVISIPKRRMDRFREPLESMENEMEE